MQKPLAMGRRSSLTQAQGGTILEAAFLGGTMKRTSRAPSKLSESVHHQLMMYALAAGAAGVSAIALAPPAHAKIIYTKTNTPILVNKPYNLDVNHDGTPDFTISLAANGYDVIAWVDVAVQGSQITKGFYNSVVITQPSRFGFAADLPPNAPVGKKRAFGELVHAMAECTVVHNRSSYQTTSRGPWRNVQSRYLGLKFSIKGETHYGWARLNVKLNKKCNYAVTLTGYAYETIPNKLIFTGHTRGPDDISVEEPHAALTLPTSEPATLGLLAMGSPGLSVWRRKERAGSTR
jgi:hypothetical protein